MPFSPEVQSEIDKITAVVVAKDTEIERLNARVGELQNEVADAERRGGLAVLAAIKSLFGIN